MSIRGGRPINSRDAPDFNRVWRGWGSNNRPAKPSEILDIMKQCICVIESSFIKDPFKYFNEKDIHFTLQKCLKEKYPKGPIHIHREYPVKVEGDEYGEGQEKQYRTAYIDLAITKLNGNHEKPIFGIEVYLGKFIDEGLINLDTREYVLNRSSEQAHTAVKHLKKDAWKLKKAVPNNYFLLYFIIHSFFRKTSGRRNERIKRISEITNELRSNKKIDQNRLVIIEVLFEKGERTNRIDLGLDEIRPPASFNDVSIQ